MRFSAVLSAILGLSGCVLPPQSGSLGGEPRLAFVTASADDAFYAAQAAAQAEIADRRVAIDFLRELAARYRIVGHARSPVLAEPATGKEGHSERPAVARAILAPPGRAAVAAAAIRKAEGDIYDALRTAFPANEGFDGLVRRCLDTIAASAGKPTYNPKLFDWLCRAAVVPEAVIRMAGDVDRDREWMTAFTVAVDRLSRLSEACRGSAEPSCRAADKTIAEIISQQPVRPVPQNLDKITVERTALTVPAPKPASDDQPIEPIKAPTNVRYARD